MFATWIPEVLEEIEQLATLPEPPTIHAISAARRGVVASGSSQSRPAVIPRGRGVEISWGDHGVYFLPFGGDRIEYQESEGI